MAQHKQLSLEPVEKSPYNINIVLDSGATALRRARIGTASLDARLLLQHVLSVTREELLADEKRALRADQYLAYQKLIDARLKRKPVSQLIGWREFWGLTFKVTEDTLDPRADSETLVEAVLSKCSDRKRALRILDFGTGTGCLLLALLAEYRNASGVGIDISEAALEVARANAQALDLSNRAMFTRSRWAERMVETNGKQMGTFDIVISNPPYIPTAEIASLEPEVRDHEPSVALDGGDDGLKAYRELIPQLPSLLAADGLAVLETGMGQEQAVDAIVTGYGMQVIDMKRDLSGIVRCLILTKI